VRSRHAGNQLNSIQLNLTQPLRLRCDSTANGAWPGQAERQKEEEEEKEMKEEEATSWYPHDLAKEDISTT